jgi:hypothetical protein
MSELAKRRADQHVPDPPLDRRSPDYWKLRRWEGVRVLTDLGLDGGDLDPAVINERQARRRQLDR